MRRPRRRRWEVWALWDRPVLAGRCWTRWGAESLMARLWPTTRNHGLDYEIRERCDDRGE